ncbi:phage tail fiber protein [Pseudomonas sp. SID14000]|uniref:phage tail fiber domain-containing protein n=1 Tax=Pseudomonas sp. SID14000 TaxID=1986221 RepID=UPI000B3CF031|nr:phage tail fiber protein [Pseudomonas sp. SID14000]
MAQTLTVYTYPLDGTRTEFPISFEYLARRFVQITLIGPTSRKVLAVTTDYRFVSPTLLKTTIVRGGSDGYTSIEVRRVTSATDRIVDFTEGSLLRASDLNTSQIQAIHIAEEARDLADYVVSVNGDNTTNAKNRRIVNVAPGVDGTDAVNKNQLTAAESAVAVSASQAAASAQRAAASAAAAAATIGDRLNPLNPKYGAVADGVVNDSAAFAKFEAEFVGRTVDLGGAIFKVDSIPRKNVYIHGSWKLSGVPNDFTRIAFEGDSVLSRPACFTPFGGGLNRLKAALTNILTQFVGVVWIGDSITWGSGNQPEMAITDPRNGTLKDPRDWFGTNSYVNNLRRYLIEEYLPGATITTAPWPLSPYGDAIVTATKDIHILPLGPEFAHRVVGAPISITNDVASGLPGKWRVLITNQNTTQGDNAYGEISFKFTGNCFRLLLGCITANASDYIIYVNGNSIGRFSTAAGDPADNGTVFVEGGHHTRTHTFPMVYNGTVTIRAVRPLVAGGDPSKVLRISSLIIPKTLRLTNNGINGSSLSTYRVYNMPPSGINFSGSVAVNAGDLFTFIQLGTNDRGTIRGPQTIPFIQQECRALLDSIPFYSTPILMASNPAIPVVNPVPANLDQSDIRSALFTVARERAIDFVDNYNVFRGLDRLAFAKDQLHPNQWGYSVVSSNIIKAIESSIDTSVVPPPAPTPTFAISPFDARFVPTVQAGSQIIDRESLNAYLGVQRLLRTNVGTAVTISFNVTGNEFGLVFSSLDNNISDYELFVDGVSKGVFITKYLEANGGTQVYNNVRWHTIGTGNTAHAVQLKTVRREEYSAIQVIYLEAFLYKEGSTIS